MTFFHSRAMPPIVGIILAVMLIENSPQIYRWWQGRGSAIEWVGVKVETKTVKAGDVLSLVYYGIVNRQCPAELRGALVAPDGTYPVRFPVVLGGYSAPSNGKVMEIPVKVKIPLHADDGLAPLKSGQYIYRTSATRYCPNGMEDDHHVPDAHFQLEVPDA